MVQSYSERGILVDKKSENLKQKTFRLSNDQIIQILHHTSILSVQAKFIPGRLAYIRWETGSNGNFTVAVKYSGSCPEFSCDHCGHTLR